MNDQKTAFPYLLLLVILLCGLPILDYRVENQLGVEIKINYSGNKIDPKKTIENREFLITQKVEPIIIPN